MAGNEQKTSGGEDSRDLYDAVLSFCAGDRKSVEVLALEPVSYTHLTLPTKA